MKNDIGIYTVVRMDTTVVIIQKFFCGVIYCAASTEISNYILCLQYARPVCCTS